MAGSIGAGGTGGAATPLNDTLTSTSTTAALTAAKGKALKDLVDGVAASDAGKAPQSAVDTLAATVAGLGAAGMTATPFPAGATPAIALDLSVGRDFGTTVLTQSIAVGFASAVANGNGQFILRGGAGGAFAATFAAFNFKGPDTPDWTAGQDNIFAAYAYSSGAKPLLYCTLGDAHDVTAPTFGAFHVDNASSNIIRGPATEPLVSNGIVAGDVTIAGKTVTGVAISGSELQITLSVAVDAGASLAVSIAAGKLKDAAGNLVAAVSSQPVTNNVIPAAPAITLGVATSSTQVMTLTAPAGATSRKVQVRTSAGPGAWADAAGSFSGNNFTATGLSPSTSYDWQANATGTAGTSAYGGIVSGSTPAAVSAILSAAAFSPSDVNLTTSSAPAFLDYFIPHKSRDGTAGDEAFNRKNGVNLLTWAMHGSASFASDYGDHTCFISWNANDAVDNTGQVKDADVVNYERAAAYQVASNSQGGITITCPGSSAAARKIRLYGHSFSDYHLKASLADGSAAPIDVTLNTNGPMNQEVTFRPSTNGSVLTIKIEEAGSGAGMGGNRDLCVQAVTLS